jgi:hyaluronoglucosaminidase
MKKLKISILSLLLLAGANLYAAVGYAIYPVPHEQIVGKGEVSLSGTVNIVCSKGIDKATRDRATQVLKEHGLQCRFSSSASKDMANLFLGVNGDKGKADKIVTSLKLSRDIFGKAKYDKHILSVSGEGKKATIVILGENTDATFCGLASLEQMLDSQPKQLSCVTLYDYADVKNRGIIEGYYGVPYSEEVTEDLFRFMARYKMNSYMYGAKSDPYHSQYWEKPYPLTITPEQKKIGMMTQGMMKNMAKVATENKVNFIWAIHPGTNFFDAKSDSVLGKIMDKYESMYKLGFRQFGVFVDDCGVPDDTASLNLGARRLTALQQLVDKRWNRKGVAPADTVKPLNYVPQLYAYSWVSKEKAERFFNSLSTTPSKTVIYITGRAVWTVPNNEDPELVKKWLGREVGWWWNYPCNDNDMDKIFVSDMYTNFHDEAHIDNNAKVPETLNVKTLISNPMQQGAASKIALFSIGDYAWNNAAFDEPKSFEAAVPAVVGKDYAAAFLTVMPYLRHYDFDSPWPTLAQMQRLAAACKTLTGMVTSKDEGTRLFYQDIEPWLKKVQDMADCAVVLLTKDQQSSEAVSKAVETVSWMDGTDKYNVEVLNGMGNDIKLSLRQATPAQKVLLPMLKKLSQTAK